MENISLSEHLTYSTVLIHTTYSNGGAGSGTGFIMNLCCQDDGKCIPVVVTNKHVINNCTSYSFEFCKATEDRKPIDLESSAIVYRTNKWIMHPDTDVDLCCLPIGDILNQYEAINEKVYYTGITPDIIPNQDTISKLSALENVIMIGYPIGLSDRVNHKPIIRRGSTALHLKHDYQGKKEFLVDMACFPGSSGSPIFILNEGSYHIGKTLIAGSRVLFVGVLYGGPQYSAAGTIMFQNLPNTPTPVVSIPTNLGIAIKADRIMEFESILTSLITK